MKLFVGLGNPGDKYRGNRHNIGFMAVERIAERHGFAPWRKKFSGLVTEGAIGGARVTLLKPETYMNDSGRSVGDAQRFLKMNLDDVIVFHDELDLAPGRIKVKTGGGVAGHNGLRSISQHVENDYQRVRIGIGHPGSKDAVSPFVLNDFAKSERAWVNALLDAIADAAPHLAHGDAARFLTEIARLSNADDDEPAKPAAPARKSAHPEGERAGKRQSALAENLRKFLSGRKSPPESS
ncbi:MAG: aminoacyl-tRNA hydrolase [Hyphomicrobium sp.]